MPKDPHETRLDHAIAFPTVRVTNSAARTATTGVTLVLLWDTETTDPFGMHDVTADTERLTVQVPGVYIVGLNVRWASDSTGLRFTIITGTSEIARSSQDANGESESSIVGISAASPGVFFEARVLQTSGGDLDVAAATSNFWAARIGG